MPKSHRPYESPLSMLGEQEQKMKAGEHKQQKHQNRKNPKQS